MRGGAAARASISAAIAAVAQQEKSISAATPRGGAPSARLHPPVGGEDGGAGAAAGPAADEEAEEEDPAVVRLTDALEHCVGGLIRLTRVVTALSDLSTPVVLSCLVPLLGMKRLVLAGEAAVMGAAGIPHRATPPAAPSPADAASRVLYAIVVGGDSGAAAAVASAPEVVRAMCGAMTRQIGGYSAASAARGGDLPPIADADVRASGARASIAAATAAPGGGSGSAAGGSADAVDVAAPLHLLLAHAVLGLCSRGPALVRILVECRMGEPLMALQRCPDVTAARCGLLALCDLFRCGGEGVREAASTGPPPRRLPAQVGRPRRPRGPPPPRLPHGHGAHGSCGERRCVG